MCMIVMLNVACVSVEIVSVLMPGIIILSVIVLSFRYSVYAEWGSLGSTTLSKMTLSIMTFIVRGLFVTLNMKNKEIKEHLSLLH
jgi:hypothetical protein